MHAHRTLSPLPENSSPGTAARARATVDAWRGLADRLTARAILPAPAAARGAP